MGSFLSPSGSHQSRFQGAAPSLPFDVRAEKRSCRRFHARFYVTFLRGTTLSGFSHGAKQDFIPTPDGGQEVISTQFIHPTDALQACRAKEMVFMPPQYYLISTLAEILTGNQNSEAQRTRVRELSEGPFGRMVILPRQSKLGDGRWLLAYEGDEMAGGPLGARHRSIIKLGAGGVSSTMEYRQFADSKGRFRRRFILRETSMYSRKGLRRRTPSFNAGHGCLVYLRRVIQVFRINPGPPATQATR